MHMPYSVAHVKVTCLPQWRRRPRHLIPGFFLKSGSPMPNPTIAISHVPKKLGGSFLLGEGGVDFYSLKRDDARSSPMSHAYPC